MTPTSVLFLIFNRPDVTGQVMEAIRAARPKRLYVAADGPRDRPGEADQCEKARQIATAVDWPCRMHTLFRDRNLGCGAAVGSAIDWFFNHEEEGIILEDDCLPSADFFRFCDELLPRFRSEERVMALCGSCYTESTFDMAVSYYFSCYSDMWGWATWRRAWRAFDRDLSRWHAFKKSGGLKSALSGAPWAVGAWADVFDRTAAGQIDTWDYQWIYTVLEQGGLACYPNRNLISNLGCRPDATHTKDVGPITCKPHQPLLFPLRHPGELVRSQTIDRELEQLRFGINKPTIRIKVLGVVAGVFRLLPTSLQSRIKAMRALLKRSRPGIVGVVTPAPGD
jgi:hypothetical protein